MFDMNDASGNAPLGKERVDRVMVGRNLVPTTEKARAMVMAGLVYSGGRRVEKPGQMVPFDADISLRETLPYVGRGGIKLAAALKMFSISVKGRTAADLGASTGGFTDCLLQNGARMVYAVDVDLRQLDWRLRTDRRVVLMEKNARYLKREDFVEPPDFVTMDLAFISVLKVLPAIKEFLGNGDLVALLKPQFEAGKGCVGKKGVVRSSVLHEEILEEVARRAREIGFGVCGLICSPIKGQKGNKEFFVHWRLEEGFLKTGEIKSRIREVVHEEKN